MGKSLDALWSLLQIFIVFKEKNKAYVELPANEIKGSLS